jgi:hypothetical protein
MTVEKYEALMRTGAEISGAKAVDIDDDDDLESEEAA